MHRHTRLTRSVSWQERDLQLLKELGVEAAFVPKSLYASGMASYSLVHRQLKAMGMLLLSMVLLPLMFTACFMRSNYHVQVKPLHRLEAVTLEMWWERAQSLQKGPTRPSYKWNSCSSLSAGSPGRTSFGEWLQCAFLCQ